MNRWWCWRQTPSFCLAHDALLSNEQRAAWTKHLTDYEITPLFAQFGRPKFELSAARSEESEIKDFEGHLLESFKLRGRLTKQGITAGGRRSTVAGGSAITSGLPAWVLRRSSSSREVRCPRKIGPLPLFPSRSSASVTRPASRERTWLLGELPLVLLTECWNDLKLAAAEGTGFDPEWQKENPVLERHVQSRPFHCPTARGSIVRTGALRSLRENDRERRPPELKLSPRTVRQFTSTGSDGKAFDHEWEGKKTSTIIRRKFYGNDALLDRCIVTLLGNRGLLMVGEPGTAKSMLSELLAAAISGISTNVIQGTAGTTEDQIKYSWNYALLLAEGPTPRALVPSPLFTGMKQGLVVRFEEITRCQPEIQDALVSVLSDKLMPVAELAGDDGVVFAAKGFNVLATANLRDRGVNEMSSALKRRFNFETVHPISDRALELQLVREQTELLLRGGRCRRGMQSGCDGIARHDVS